MLDLMWERVSDVKSFNIRCSVRYSVDEVLTNYFFQCL